MGFHIQLLQNMKTLSSTELFWDTPPPPESQDQIVRFQVNFSLQKCYEFLRLNRCVLIMNSKREINIKISKTPNQGCKQRSKKNQPFINLPSGLMFKKIVSSFTIFCGSIGCWPFKMWSFLGSPPSRCGHLQVVSQNYNE